MKIIGKDLLECEIDSFKKLIGRKLIKRKLLENKDEKEEVVFQNIISKDLYKCEFSGK